MRGNSMTWEQKLAALKAVAGDVYLYMRYPGDWMVSIKAERKEGSLLCSGLDTNCATPEAAVESRWVWATAQSYYLVIGHGKDRKAARWNGFMWDAVDEAADKAGR